MGLVLCCSANMPAGEEHPAKHRITVRMDKQTVVLGAKVAVTVTYSNSGNDVWRLAKPESSTRVLLHYAAEGSSHRGNSHSIGQRKQVSSTLPSGEVMVVTIAPPRSDIEIKKGEVHTFSIDLGPQGDAVNCPGIWKIWIEDREENLLSDKAAVRVAFNEDSVPLLLAIAEENQDTSLPGWARDWLRRIKPDFRLKIPDWGRETKEGKTARIMESGRAIASFRKFWDQEKDSERMRELFNKINEEAATAPASGGADRKRKQG